MAKSNGAACKVPATKTYKTGDKKTKYTAQRKTPTTEAKAQTEVDRIRRAGYIAKVVPVCGGHVPYKGRKRKKTTIKATGQRLSGTRKKSTKRKRKA